MFTIIGSNTNLKTTDFELCQKLIEFSQSNDLHIVAFEYITDADGKHWTYDINCNTNYNSRAEEKWGNPDFAWSKVADYLNSQF
jgi:hypothetical protein